METVTRRAWGTSVLVLGLSTLAAGCELSAPLVWVESSESFELPADSIRQFAAHTHNGSIRVGAAAADQATIAVRVKIRAGAPDQDSAEACLANVEIITPTSGDDGEVQELRWRWRERPPFGWQVTVSYDAAMPPTLALVAETHNGDARAIGLGGDCRLRTHNGSVHVTAHAGDHLDAETHNGRVLAETSAQSVRLVTHNAGVRALVAGQGPLDGEIATHNGSVDVYLSPNRAAQLECRTQNGRIRRELELADLMTKQNRRLSGRLGEVDDPDEATLQVETHNGSIRLAPADAYEAADDDQRDDEGDDD